MTHTVRRPGAGVLAAPALLPVVVVLGLLAGARRRARAAGGEAGASVVEWVLILATTITIAVGVGAIIYSKVRSKAEGLDLSTP